MTKLVISVGCNRLGNVQEKINPSKSGINQGIVFPIRGNYYSEEKSGKID